MTLQKPKGKRDRESRPDSYNPQAIAKFAGCQGAFASYRDSVFLHEVFSEVSGFLLFSKRLLLEALCGDLSNDIAKAKGNERKER